MPTTVPWREIDTVFLDAGNTLMSMDFAWIAELLAPLGVRSDVQALSRAEARARPHVSRRLASGGSTETEDNFTFYLRTALEALAPPVPELERVCAELVRVLRRPGTTPRLWSRVLPGVPEALEALRGAGFRLGVVSNSDGTVEQGLAQMGLRAQLDFVVDSHVVGFPKPDPRIFRCALELAGSAPERTLHVGDIYSVDVSGARGAGLHALLLDPYDDWPDVDCERAPDLLALARRLTSG